MQKNNTLYERNNMPVHPFPMNYIKGPVGIYGVSTTQVSTPPAGDIYVVKKELSQIKTGMIQIIIPENFELFNVQYSADELSGKFDRMIYAIYTFTRIKNKKERLEI